MREATNTPITTLKESNASAAETGETLHTTTVARILHLSKLYGRMAKRKPLLKTAHVKSPLEFTQRYVGDFTVKWKKVLCSDETKMELFLAIRLDTMFGAHQTLHITTNTPSSL